MTEDGTLQELKARLEAQSRKIRMLEKEIEKIKAQLVQKRLKGWLL